MIDCRIRRGYGRRVYAEAIVTGSIVSHVIAVDYSNDPDFDPRMDVFGEDAEAFADVMGDVADGLRAAARDKRSIVAEAHMRFRSELATFGHVGGRPCSDPGCDRCARLLALTPP